MDQTHLLPKRPHATMLQPTGSGQAWETWQGIVDAEHSLEDVLHPNYFWNWHDRIRAGDEIHLRHELHKFRYKGYVTKIHEDTASIHLAADPGYPQDLKEAPRTKADLSEAVVEYAGPSHKHRVRTGHQILKAGFPTKQAAEDWLDEQRAA